MRDFITDTRIAISAVIIIDMSIISHSFVFDGENQVILSGYGKGYGVMQQNN